MLRDFRLIAVCGLGLALLGCQTTGAIYDSSRVNSSEELLEAEGPYEIVQTDKKFNPRGENLQARKKVNPAQTRARCRYTSCPKASEMAEHMHVRVLEMQKKDDSAFAGLKLAQADTGITSDVQARQAEAAARNAALYGGNAKPIGATHSDNTAATPKAVSDERNAAKAAPVPEKKPDQGGESKSFVERLQSSFSHKASTEEEQKAEISPFAAKAMRVRAGNHPGKVRLVIDVDSKTDFSPELDNKKGFLFVRVPAAAWSGVAADSFGSNPIVAGYAAKSEDHVGTIVAFELVRPAKLAWSAMLPPNDVHPYYRIVLDIAAE